MVLAAQLVGGHGVGLVAGQKGNVDVFENGHLGDVLGIAGDVDAETVEGEYVAVVTTLGVELVTACRGVVGRYGLEGEAVAEHDAVAVLHDACRAVHLCHVRIGEDDGVGTDQLCQCHAVKVVGMLVGDEDVVGARHGGVVGFGLQASDGVEVEGHAVVLDEDAGVFDTGELDLFSGAGLEGVCLAALCAGSAAGADKEAE